MSRAREVIERRTTVQQLLRRRGLPDQDEGQLGLDEVAGYLTGSLDEAEEQRVETAALANSQDRRRIRRLRRVFEGRVAPVFRARAGTQRRMDSRLTVFFRRYGALVLAGLVFAAVAILPFSGWALFSDSDYEAPRRALIVAKLGSPLIESDRNDQSRPAYPGIWLEEGDRVQAERGDRLTLLFEDGTFRRIDVEGQQELSTKHEPLLARLFRRADESRPRSRNPRNKEDDAERAIPLTIKVPRGQSFERRPTVFWFGGRRNAEYRVRMTADDGTLVFSRLIRGDRVSFPASALDLLPGRGYRVELLSPESGEVLEAARSSILAEDERGGVEAALAAVDEGPGAALLRAMAKLEFELVSEAARDLERIREREADNLGVLLLLEFAYERLGLEVLARRMAEIRSKRAG